jgi:hypothetical protein
MFSRSGSNFDLFTCLHVILPFSPNVDSNPLWQVNSLSPFNGKVLNLLFEFLIGDGKAQKISKTLL